MPATYKPKKAYYQGDTKTSWKYLLWCACGTAVFMFFSPIFEHLSSYVPDVDTGSEFFEKWYYRSTVETTWLPLSQLVALFGLSIYGWCFINLINCQRKNPFTSGNEHYKDIKMMLLMTPILFFFSGIVVLRDAHDLSGYCAQNDANGAVHNGKTIYLQMSPEDSANVDTLSAVLETDDDLVLLFHTIQQSNYLKSYGGQNAPACKTYTQEEVYAYNQHFWVAGFFLLGLQFTHTHVGPLAHFSLTKKCLSQMGLIGWVVFAMMAVTCGSVLYFALRGLAESNVLLRYLGWAVILLGFIVWNTKRLSPGRSLHIHHYFLSWMMLTFICYQSEFLTFMHGFAMGVYIEGGARWGFDPIWTANETAEEVDDLAITKPKAVSKHTTQERMRWIDIKHHQNQVRSQNEKKVAESQVDAPQHPVFQQRVSQVPQTSYLQPTMISMPLPAQPPTMQYVTYVPQMAPQPMQQPMQQQPVQQLQQPIYDYGSVYRPEAAFLVQQPVQQLVAPRTAPLPTRQQSNLPPELLGLLSRPEL